MKKRKDYMPAGQKSFFDWQENLVARVVLNAVAWLIAAGKVTALQAQEALYLPLYNAIKIKAARTPQQIDAHKVGRKAYRTYLRTFVKENLIGNTAITHDEKVGLGLNPGGIRGARTKILTAPDVQIKAKGSLVVRLEFRVEGDESRPSIHEDSDGLEIRSIIGTTPPANYQGATEVATSSKASFNYIFEDPTVAGKTVYLYARWKNNSDDKKSGPWSAMANVVIR